MKMSSLDSTCSEQTDQIESNRSLYKEAEPASDLVADYIDDYEKEISPDLVSADSDDQSLEIENEAIEMKLLQQGKHGAQDINHQILIAPELTSR